MHRVTFETAELFQRQTIAADFQQEYNVKLIARDLLFVSSLIKLPLALYNEGFIIHSPYAN